VARKAAEEARRRDEEEARRKAEDAQRAEAEAARRAEEERKRAIEEEERAKAERAKREILALEEQRRQELLAARQLAASSPSEAVQEEEWVECRDPASGKPYWYNRATGESSWVKPGSQQLQSNGGGVVPPSQLASQWVEYKDDSSGLSYWYNTKTGESVWENPNGDDAPQDAVRSVAGGSVAGGSSSASLSETILGVQGVLEEIKVPGAQPMQPASASDPWERYVDEAYGLPYWYNKASGESTWSDPHADSDAKADELQGAVGQLHQRSYEEQYGPLLSNRGEASLNETWPNLQSRQEQLMSDEEFARQLQEKEQSKLAQREEARLKRISEVAAMDAMFAQELAKADKTGGTSAAGVAEYPSLADGFQTTSGAGGLTYVKSDDNIDTSPSPVQPHVNTRSGRWSAPA